MTMAMNKNTIFRTIDHYPNFIRAALDILLGEDDLMHVNACATMVWNNRLLAH